MPYVSPGAVTTGTTITSTWGTQVKTAADYLANPPACRVYHNAAQAVASGATLVVAFNQERFKTVAGMHSTVTNNSRITFTDAGLYVVTGMVAFTNAADYSLAQAWLRLNGTTVIVGSNSDPSTVAGEAWINITTVYKFAASDYIEMLCTQTNGAAASRNVLNQPNYSPELAATWIGLG